MCKTAYLELAYGESTYGYKGRIFTTKKGLIGKTKVTSAEVHDSQGLESLLDETITKVYANKAYPSKARRQRLKAYQREIFSFS